MKVIDLLNKIANDEELPKKFKFAQQTFTKNGSYIEDEYGDSIFESLLTDFSNLDDEIEIIEEDKQIKKFEINYARDIEEKIFYEESDKPNHCILRDAGTELLINKINELIDTVNKLKKESDK